MFLPMGTGTPDHWSRWDQSHLPFFPDLGRIKHTWEGILRSSLTRYFSAIELAFFRSLLAFVWGVARRLCVRGRMSPRRVVLHENGYTLAHEHLASQVHREGKVGVSPLLLFSVSPLPLLPPISRFPNQSDGFQSVVSPKYLTSLQSSGGYGA